MNKSTIELQRIKNFPYGYGRMSYPTENSYIVLDKLVEWSKENPNTKIYKHIVYASRENIHKEFGEVDTSTYCDVVDYIDIYWQES